jgi:hypothetical protein
MLIYIWDRVRQLGEMGVSSNGKVGERNVDIRCSKMVIPTCVDWGSFIVDPWTSIWLSINRMPNFWGPVNQRRTMIVVVRRYPTIPLKISIRILYGPPTDSPECGIMWKTCTRKRWDPDWPYGIVTKGCHTRLSTDVRMSCWSSLYLYRVCYWFRSSQHSRIWVITCSLPLIIEMHVYYYKDD